MKNDDFEFLSLKMTQNEIDFFNEDLIENRMKMNSVIKTARNHSKGKKCLICGDEVSGFCNSHTIPAFCLRNLSEDWKLLSANYLINLPMLDKAKGINNTSTFHLICRKCDSECFQEYENPDNYIKIPTGKMLAQIAMKNNLKMIDKRLLELSLPEAANINKMYYSNELKEIQKEVKDIDLNEYKIAFEKAKRLSKKDNNDEYYLFEYIVLNYKVPIAFQGLVALVYDLDGKIINNIYNKDPHYKIANMHICIFPLKQTSVVMAFIDSKDKRYRSFYRKFKKKSITEKLSIINYIIFLYTEDYYFSSKISQEIFENDHLKKIACQTDNMLATIFSPNPIEAAKGIYDLQKHNTIPNILSSEYCIE